MGIPGPIVGGTFTFIFLGVLVCGAGIILKKMRKLNKDETQ
jgi:hypothetical protein